MELTWTSLALHTLVCEHCRMTDQYTSTVRSLTQLFPWHLRRNWRDVACQSIAELSSSLDKKSNLSISNQMRVTQPWILKRTITPLWESNGRLSGSCFTCPALSHQSRWSQRELSGTATVTLYYCNTNGLHFLANTAEMCKNDFQSVLYQLEEWSFM